MRIEVFILVFIGLHIIFLGKNIFAEECEITISDSDIPVGSNVVLKSRFWNQYFPTVVGTISSIGGEGVPDCEISFMREAPFDLDDEDQLIFRPGVAGAGGLFFGAVTKLMRDVRPGDIALEVESTQGMSVGNRLALVGFDARGNEAFATCEIKALTSHIVNTTPCEFSQGTGIDVEYQDPFLKKFFDRPIATTYLYPDEVSRGTTKSYVLRLDTTGLTTNETLRVDIPPNGTPWSDSLMWSVSIPYGILGGTLVY